MVYILVMLMILKILLNQLMNGESSHRAKNSCNLQYVLFLFFIISRSKFLLPFDHHYPGKNNDEQKPLVTVVLYGDFGNQIEFKPFHSKLVSLALNGKID